MRIIKQGKLPKDETVKKCKNCETKFAYTSKDVNSDPRDGDYVICPICKKWINHN